MRSASRSASIGCGSNCLRRAEFDCADRGVTPGSAHIGTLGDECVLRAKVKGETRMLSLFHLSPGDRLNRPSHTSPVNYRCSPLTNNPRLQPRHLLLHDPLRELIGRHVIRPECLPEEMIHALNTVARRYRPVQRGADLLSLQNDDENKSFGIAFRTPPTDCT